MSVTPVVIARPAEPRTGVERVALLALPGGAYLFVAFAVPLALLLVTSVTSDGHFTLAGYARFLADPFSWTVIANTLRVATLTTIVCVLAGYPAAFALARARGALQGMLLAASIGEEGKPVVAGFLEEVPNGARLK